MNERQSQRELIRKHLNKYGSITPMQALKLYGCFRLASRICELRLDGMWIKSKMVKSNGKWFAKYSRRR